MYILISDKLHLPNKITNGPNPIRKIEYDCPYISSTDCVTRTSNIGVKGFRALQCSVQVQEVVKDAVHGAYTCLWYQDGATHKRKRGYRWRATIGGEAPASRSNWAPRDFTPSTIAMRSAFQYRQLLLKQDIHRRIP